MLECVLVLAHVFVFALALVLFWYDISDYVTLYYVTWYYIRFYAASYIIACYLILYHLIAY